MIRLQTLGQIDLSAADGGELRGILAQPKRLALLVYLGIAAPRFCRRDTLVGLFWPELDSEHARGALRKATYFLRQQAGEELFARRGTDEVGLADGAVDLDVARFEAAAREGRAEDALELYRGDFLTGFFVSGAPEVERWIEDERERIRGIAIGCAWEVAEARQSSGDYEAARKWAEWALNASPPSEAGLRRLLSFLDKSGDRAAAFAAYHTFAERLADEYGIAPSDETRALLDTLRTRVEQMEPRRAASRAPLPPAHTQIPVNTSAAQTTVNMSAAHTPVSHIAGTDRRPRAGVWAAGAAVLMAVIVAAAMMLRPRPAASSDGATRIAIMPFAAQTSPELQYLDDGLVVLLATRLDGAAELRAVNARSVLMVAEREGATVDAAAIAARFDANLYVTGSAAQAGDQLVLDAALFRRGSDRPIATAQANGGETDLLAMIDDIAKQLLAGYVRGRSGNMAETAIRTSGSLPAVKAYLRGESHMRAAQYEDASQAFGEATSIDTMFALAYYRKSLATAWTGRMTEAQGDANRAARLGDRLGERERLLVDVLATRSANSAEAERGYRLYLERYPDDFEAWFELAEVVFHHAPVRGGSVSDARPAFEQVLSYDRDNQPALVHLARIAAAEGENERLADLTAHVIRLSPKGAHSAEMRLLRATVLRDRGAEDALVRDVAWEGSSRILDAAWRVSSYARVGSQLRGILTRLEPFMTGEWHAGLLLLDAHLTAAQGEWPEALRALDWLRPHAPVAALATLGLFASHPDARLSRAELTRIRSALDQADIGTTHGPRPRIYVGHTAADTLDPTLRDYYVAAISLRLGDEAEAAARLANIAARPRTLASGLVVAHLNALLAIRRGKREEALQLLRAACTRSALTTASTTPFFPRAILRRTIIETLSATGQHAEAARWTRSLPEDLGFGVSFQN